MNLERWDWGSPECALSPLSNPPPHPADGGAERMVCGHIAGISRTKKIHDKCLKYNGIIFGFKVV